MFCGTLFFKLSRNKLVKKLFTALENPETYLEIYNELKELFINNKSTKYDDELIVKLINIHLEKRGLKTIEEIEQDINNRDNNIIILDIKKTNLELVEHREVMERKICDLQELVLNQMESMKKEQEKERKKINLLKDNKKNKSRISILAD